MPEALTVADSSCLIALSAAGHLPLLHHLYGTIDVPGAVVRECGEELPKWIRLVRDVLRRAGE